MFGSIAASAAAADSTIQRGESDCSGIELYETIPESSETIAAEPRQNIPESQAVEATSNVLEKRLKSVIAEASQLSPWRGRLYLILHSGVVIPSKMVDLPLFDSCYASLTASEFQLFQKLGIDSPIVCMKYVVLSKLQHIAFIVVLLVSITLLCIETYPFLDLNDFMFIFILECTCMVLFTFEVLCQYICMQNPFPATNVSKSWLARHYRRIRMLTVVLYLKPVLAQEKIQEWSYERCTLEKPRELNRDPDKGKWSWLLLDAIATFPYFLEILVFGVKGYIQWRREDGSIDSTSMMNEFLMNMYGWGGSYDGWRIFRLLRVARLLKMAQKSDRINVIWKAIKESMEGVRFLMLLLPMFVLLTSFILFYVELSGATIQNNAWYYSDGTLCQFQSVTDCFWVIIVTITTVGYGDYVPKTPQGKIIMSIVMFLSLFIIAFPLCIITMHYSRSANEFSESKANRSEAARELREKYAKKVISRKSSPEREPRQPPRVFWKDPINNLRRVKSEDFPIRASKKQFLF